ncbi:MAG: sugar phosphate isomerase/epimerase [Acidobacteriota bacterium]|nr:sugar phosphate isomerase/epimerase [Acidobacteriota bacterium]
MTSPTFSRRAFLASAAAAPLMRAAATAIPVGIELFSVRDQMAKDTPATVRAIGRMGYQVVEFFGPYFQWTPAQAREARQAMDDSGLRCHSTHNGPDSFTGDGIARAIELNRILGAKYIVMASAGRAESLDDWKKVAETLTLACEKFRPAGLRGGYHNHQAEFRAIAGKRPIEVIAANTPRDFMLQLDVGTCVEVGQDPVAWILANPGRINSLHLKDWGAGADRGYRVLFGEGDAPWRRIFEAAESKGGVEYYLIEQEGSRYPAMETAEKCLAAYRKMRA